MLSAFYSGCETGFYRVSRVRLLIDALEGNRFAKLLLWSSNNPAAFVGTTLVGNNVANYVTSLGVVMAAGYWFPGTSSAEILLSVAVSPIVFVYGELLPKKLFFAAPYGLLKKCVPLLSASAALFSPISGLLWAVSLGLQKLVGTPTQGIELVLRRRELSDVLAEGHAIGLLAPTQRQLAQATFTLASRPIRDFAVPATRQTTVTTAISRQEVVRIGRRFQMPVMPVKDPAQNNAVIGAVKALDCVLQPDGKELPIVPIANVSETASFLTVLLRLQSEGQSMAAIRSSAGKLIGYVTLDQLRGRLLSESES